MHDDVELAARFEAHRGELRGVAYRMLGSLDEADDAVQEAWLRAARSDLNGIENLGAWLTTVVARICLDALRRRGRHPEQTAFGSAVGFDAPHAGAGPEDEAVMAESVGRALLVVLDRLTPAERVAFVLHDVFAVPFDQVAATLGSTSTASKKLASRARSKIRGPSVL